MGTLLKAECSCGHLVEKITFGAGMGDYKKCFVPALKNGSSTIEMIDIRKQSNRLYYTFYTDKLFFKDDSDDYFNAWEFKIKRINNLCPKCKKYRMNFIYVGEYD